jgi:pimeloyl-ACP methyl ester carboxylesterase
MICVVRCCTEMPGWKTAITSFTQSGSYGDLARQITQITHPTLILWGTADQTLGISDATRFEQAISGSRLVWVAQAGHVPHLDQPQAVATHLLDFAG